MRFPDGDWVLPLPVAARTANASGEGSRLLCDWAGENEAAGGNANQDGRTATSDPATKH